MKLGLPIAEGNTAHIYRNEDKIIKIFKDYLPDTEATYEANKQKHAYSCGLLVPEIFEVTTLDGKQAIIMEYVKGRTLGDLLLKNMEHAEYYLNMSIDIQQKVHKIVTDDLGAMAKKLAKQIESAKLLDKSVKFILLQKLNSMTYENRLCHGDFHLFNLILSNHKVTIIDWVDASCGDIRADVYRSYLLYTQLSEELAELYLHHYCKKSGLSKEEILKWAPIIAGARLAENMSSEENTRLLEIVHQSI